MTPTRTAPPFGAEGGPAPAAPARLPPVPAPAPLTYAPFLRAPEASRTIFTVIFAAALAPLAAGVFFFGWRALLVAGLCVGGCVVVESLYYRLTRTPALLGRSHAALTGLLLALTLPAFCPWYVALAGSVCAIILGKALFGGVGHFLWQPALVGRLAVAVVFAPPFWNGEPLNPPRWPLLAPNRVLVGDIADAQAPESYTQWRGAAPEPGADALLLPLPTQHLRELVKPSEPPPVSLVTALLRMPPAWDLVCGARGGGIGETCAIAIILAGLYLVYRNYVQGQLPGLFILAAAVTAAVAPLPQPAGGWRWLPVTAEGADVGVTYVAYHLFSGELLLAAWFFATEMTSRPITAPAQAIFGLLCGLSAMLLRLYTALPIPAYGAVLLCNTLTPVLDWIRPRVFGRRRWWQRRLRSKSSRP